MSAVGVRLVEAIAAQDASAIAACFAEDLKLRALIPPGLREQSGGLESASMIAGWFADSTQFDLIASHMDEVGDKLHISYRFEGVKEDEPYLVEQHLFCLVTEGKVSQADLLCSGFRRRHFD